MSVLPSIFVALTNGSDTYTTPGLFDPPGPDFDSERRAARKPTSFLSVG